MALSLKYTNIKVFDTALMFSQWRSRATKRVYTLIDRIFDRSAPLLSVYLWDDQDRVSDDAFRWMSASDLNRDYEYFAAPRAQIPDFVAHWPNGGGLVISPDIIPEYLADKLELRAFFLHEDVSDTICPEFLKIAPPAKSFHLYLAHQRVHRGIRAFYDGETASIHFAENDDDGTIHLLMGLDEIKCPCDK